jgi:hypothetical protein
VIWFPSFSRVEAVSSPYLREVFGFAQPGGSILKVTFFPNDFFPDGSFLSPILRVDLGYSGMDIRELLDYIVSKTARSA